VGYTGYTLFSDNSESVSSQNLVYIYIPQLVAISRRKLMISHWTENDCLFFYPFAVRGSVIVIEIDENSLIRSRATWGSTHIHRRLECSFISGDEYLHEVQASWGDVHRVRPTKKIKTGEKGNM